MTSSLIEATFRKADLLGRMEKWSVELGKFHIEYESMTAIKGQILADFITEFTGIVGVESDNALPIPTGGQNTEITKVGQHIVAPHHANQ